MTQQLSLFPDQPQSQASSASGVRSGKGKSPQTKAAPSMLRQAVAEYLPTVNDLPATERPRTRLEHYGSGALATSELLAGASGHTTAGSRRTAARHT